MPDMGFPYAPSVILALQGEPAKSVTSSKVKSSTPFMSAEVTETENCDETKRETQSHFLSLTHQ
jgi:hypothetical protein